jgi:hypothetical protein
MKASKHTTGPWNGFKDKWDPNPDENTLAGIESPSGYVMYYRDCGSHVMYIKKADQDRIFACVNACEGFDDPSVIPELRYMLDYLYNEVKYRSHIPGEMLERVRSILLRAEGRK